MSDRLTRQGVRDLGGNHQPRRDTCQHRYGPVHPIGKERWTGWSSDVGDQHRLVAVYGRTCIYCEKVIRVDA